MRKPEIKKSNSLKRKFSKKIIILIGLLFCLSIGSFVIARNTGAFSNGKFTFGFTNPKPTPVPQAGKPKRNTKTKVTSTTTNRIVDTSRETSESNLAQILASADFNLIGLVGTVTPSNQAVPKNIPTSVRTSIKVPDGEDPAPIIAQLNSNYRIRGELTGPSFTSPRMVEAPIGEQIPIPAMPIAGDHVIQNLRIVDETDATGVTIAPVTPDAVGITVIENILVSQVQVSEMTYEEIVQSGINLNNNNYTFYNFVIGLGTSSGTVPIQIPVAMPTTGGQPPVVGNPTGGVTVGGVPVPLPDIVPVMLEGVNEEGEPVPLETGGGGPLQIPGVVVFPGRIGLLNQFFEAVVIVANGAPNGTPLVVSNLRAKAKLPDAGTPNNPDDDPLRIAETQQGGVQTQLEIHGLGPDGRYGTADDTRSFNPGQSGQATFLVEGLREGLHTINFDLEGTLQGLPGGNITVRGNVPGAVLVRDAEFGVTFTHPSVVRAGQEYELGLTVFNSGSRDLNGIVMSLSGDSVSGAELIDDVEKSFNETIPPGSSGTVKWKLRSRTTGQVTASYVKVGGNIDAGINLVTGVGDRRIPLSPDSLILPDPVNKLPEEVVEAARQMLGQAWSIATAPSGTLPSGVLPVDKRTVISKAVELGWAGLRIEFHEDRDTSLRTLLRDWLGENQSNSSWGFSDALRNTPAGYYFFDTVGTKFYESLINESPENFHKKLADAESSRSAFISALITQADGQQIFGAKIVSPTNESVGFGANANERFGDLRTGASLNFLHNDPHSAANTTRGNLLLASKPANGNWSLELYGWKDGMTDVSILVPTSGKNYRQLVFKDIPLTTGKRYRITFKSSGTTAPIVEEFVNGAFRPATLLLTTTEITEPNPVITGVVQVTEDVVEGGDGFGRLVGVLFSKPMVKNSVETIGRYQIGGGELVSDPSQIVGRPIKPTGSAQNFGERFAILALDSPVGPFISRNITANGLVDKSGKVITGSTEQIEMRVSPQGTPRGGYMTGRVMQADGTPVSYANVFYRGLRSPCSIYSEPETIAYQKADLNGEFTIDYVREGECNPVNVFFQHTQTNSEKSLTSNIAYHGQHLIFNAVFLARGKVQGTVTSGGVPLANAYVNILSELDALNNKVVRTNNQGFYTASGVPVGGITVKAVGTGNYSLSSGIAAGNLNGPGETTTINVTTQNTSGVIKGKVRDAADNKVIANSLVIARANIPGFPNIDGPIPVGFSFTGEDGSFSIEKLPIGTVYLEAYDPQRGVRTSTTVHLTEQIKRVENVILLISNGFGRVSGKVVNELGQPIPNAVVQEGLQAVEADALGDYILPQIREGNVNIIATDPITRQKGSTTITVRRNENTTGANIVIRRPATLNGQVFVNQNGTVEPLAGAYVSTDGFKIVRTDSQGRYTLSDVQSGADLVLRFVHPQGKLFVNTEVRLNAGETLSRNAIFRSGKIHGRITQPNGVTPVVAGVDLKTLRPQLAQNASFGIPEVVTLNYQTTPDGRYSFENLNPSGFTVSTSNSFFPITVSQSGALPPNADLEINLSLVDTLAGKLKGRIYQPDGTTPVGAGVKVSLGGGSLADVTVRTNDEGFYEFAEVFAAGSYALTAVDPATSRTNRTRVEVKKNADVEVDLRLLGRGNLKVKAVDGNGNPLSAGSIKIEGVDYPNDERYIELTPVNNGQFEFANLTEGKYAVSVLYNNLGGRVSSKVNANGTTEVTIQIRAVGKVTGRVFMPDGTTPVGLADVTLVQNGRTIGFITTQDSEEDRGKFAFDYVPTGDFVIEVFDNRSGRRGRSAGTVIAQDQVANVNVNLLALGTVAGRVTANGVSAGHVLVQLSGYSSENGGITRVTTTDENGNYRFPGVPVGQAQVWVSNGPGGTYGSAQGIVLDSAEPLILDVALTPTASVTGTVYKFGGTEVYPGALVRVSSNYSSINTVTDENGRYQVNFVPLGTVNVKVESPFGYDRGKSAPIVSNQPGATLTADVTMAGVGSISGMALGSNGSPLSTGKVTFTNVAWGENITIDVPVQLDGTYSLTGIPAGEFNLKLTVPDIIGVGTAAGNLAGGQTINQNLQLDAAGKISGRVLSVDGSTPAVGADVTLKLTKPNYFSYTFIAHTDSNGNWAVENLPLGTASVNIFDTSSGGRASVSGLILNANGQQLDTGDVVLQRAPLSVASVIPSDYSSNVSVDSVVQIAFSEPIDADTVGSNSVKLMLGDAPVNVARAVSSDGSVVILTPEQNLAEGQLYKVVVTPQIKTRIGSPLPYEFNSRFTTASPNTDNEPPIVVAINPAGGALQIAVNTPITARFNERLDADQDFSTILKVTDYSQNTPESGSYSLSSDGRIVTFTPNALAANKRYAITVKGQKDTLGNTQNQMFSSMFTTIDTVAPVISSFKINGKTAVDGMLISTPRPSFDVNYEDELGIDTDAVKLYLYKVGTPVLDVPAQIYSWRLYYRPEESLLTGTYKVKAVITDYAGNQADGGEFEFSFSPQQPEIISLSDQYAPTSGNSIITINGSQLISGLENSDDSQRGLLGEYYSCYYNGCLDNVKLVRLDETVNFETFNESIVPFIYSNEEAIRWRGKIIPRYTETYNFEARYNGNFVLKINGINVISDSSFDVGTTQNQISLEAGRIYDIEIQSTHFRQYTGAHSFNEKRVVQFFWSSPSQQRELVPAERLRPAQKDIAPTVTIGGQPATVIGAISGDSDQLSIIVPPGTAGTADVQIQNENGTATLSGVFEYYADVNAPALFNVSPHDTKILNTSPAQVSVTFDEPLASGQNLDEILKIHNETDNVRIDGTVSIDETSRRLKFVPANPFPVNKVYRVVTEGQTDTVGNVASNSSTKFTVDGSPPTVTFQTPGAVTYLQKPRIAATISDVSGSVRYGSIKLFVDEIDVTNQTNIYYICNYVFCFPYSQTDGLNYTPTSNLAFGAHTARVQATDLAGNTVNQTLNFTVSPDDVPPSITNVRIADRDFAEGFQTANRYPNIQVYYEDNLPVTPNRQKIYFGPQGGTLAHVATGSSQNYLYYYPQEELPFGFYTYRIELIDNQNNTTVRDVTFEVADLDITPPSVVAVVPDYGATQVDSNTAVTLTFSEPLEPSQNFADSIRIYNYAIQEIVAGTYQLDSAGTTLTFTPSQALPENSTYIIEGYGYLDLVGNGGYFFYSSFSTNDTEPPVVDAGRLLVDDEEDVELNGAEIFDQTPRIRFSYYDSTNYVNPDSIVFTLDGQQITTGVEQWGIDYESPTALSYGQHTVTLQVADIVGNVSQLKTETFTVMKDARTPFAVESDTTLLWRLNERSESYPNMTPDAGDYKIHGIFPPQDSLTGSKTTRKTGKDANRKNDKAELKTEQKTDRQPRQNTADSASLYPTQRGRFGGAVSYPELTSIDDERIASLGNAGFTVEGWMKLTINSAGNPYTIWAKGNGSARDFELLLTPAGNLIARLYNSNNQTAELELPKETFDVADNKWHSLAMTVEADGNVPHRLKLYIDGQMRSDIAVPQSFGTIRNSGGEFDLGRRFYYDSYASVFDEVRISSTAHSAETIFKTFNSVDLGLVITRLNASVIPGNNTTELIVEGYNLDSVTGLNFTDLNGNPVAVTASITEKSKVSLKATVAVDASVPSGDIRLNLTDGQTVVFRDVRVAPQQGFQPDAGTLMLFNMNEPQGEPLVNSGTLGGAGEEYYLYEILNGRFGNGRKGMGTNNANLTDYINSSFTTEFWMKAGQPDRDANLMVYGTDYDGLDTKIVEVVLSTRGEIKAALTDSNHLRWQAATQIGDVNVLNDQWHLISMVVTRDAQQSSNTMKIYVDGVEKASSIIPNGFGTAQGQTSYLFHLNRFRSRSAPGGVDDFRLLNYPRTAAEILGEWNGTNALRGVGLLFKKSKDRIDKNAALIEKKANRAVSENSTKESEPDDKSTGGRKSPVDDKFSNDKSSRLWSRKSNLQEEER